MPAYEKSGVIGPVNRRRRSIKWADRRSRENRVVRFFSADSQTRPSRKTPLVAHANSMLSFFVFTSSLSTKSAGVSLIQAISLVAPIQLSANSTHHTSVLTLNYLPEVPQTLSLMKYTGLSPLKF